MSLSKIVDYSILREQGRETVDERIEKFEKQKQISYIEKKKYSYTLIFCKRKRSIIMIMQIEEALCIIKNPNNQVFLT